MFWHHGRFVATDVMTPDILTLWMLCDGRFVTGRFVTGRFVGESLIGLLKGKDVEISAEFIHPLSCERPFNFLCHLV
jgi:hypothetical protein